MKKRWGIRFVTLSAVFMAGIALNGCMPKAIKDVAMDLYEEKSGKNSKEKEAGQEPQGDADDASDKADLDEADQEDRSPADGEGTDGTGADSAEAGGYAGYIKEELEPRYGKGDNTAFSYGYEEVSYTDTDYWFASPMMAQLEDGIIATCQRDLDKDGVDELLLLYTEGSKGSGAGQNSIGLKVYSEKGGTVTEMGGLRLEDCFNGYNREDHMIGLKDVGDKRLIYVERGRSIYTWADGEYPEISLYQYDGSSLKSVYQVSEAGSDPTWCEQWKRDLNGFGFVLPSYGNEYGDIGLTGEPGFEVLAYGECRTNEPSWGLAGGTVQQWMLDNGRIEGGIYGPGSDIVKRLNQGMTAYAGGGYTGGSGNMSGSMPGGGTSGGMSGGGYSAGDYILPESSTRYLTRQDLYGLTKDQLRLARNEIYARHGRKFQTQEIQDYFNSKSWYTGTIEPKDFREEYLNVYEKENVKLIQSLED